MFMDLTFFNTSHFMYLFVYSVWQIFKSNRNDIFLELKFLVQPKEINKTEEKNTRNLKISHRGATAYTIGH